MKKWVRIRSGLVGIVSASWLGLPFWVAVQPVQAQLAPAQPLASPAMVPSTPEQQQERLEELSRTNTLIQQELQMRQNIEAPSGERKQPDIFCLSFIMRTSRSA